MSMRVKIKLVDGAIEPNYATAESAGMDIRAHIDNDVIIPPGYRMLIKTGLYLEMEEDLEAQIRPRSGLALKYGITVLNSPGTIDSDYRGEIGVILINHGQADFVVENGMRIAQMVFAKHEKVVCVTAEYFNKETERGEGGFGSTGA